MKREKLYKEIWYSCPVCGKRDDDYSVMLNHYKSHPIKQETYIGCNICGEGYNVGVYGELKAQALARACVKKHILNKEVDSVATKTFFLSKGVRGWINDINESEQSN